MKTLLIFLIRLYQATLSPLIGNCCRFNPTCSEYACQMIRSQGIGMGVWLTLRRLLTCHPFHRS